MAGALGRLRYVPHMCLTTRGADPTGTGTAATDLKLHDIDIDIFSRVRVLHQHHHQPFISIIRPSATRGLHQTEPTGDHHIAMCRFYISLSGCAPPQASKARPKEDAARTEHAHAPHAGHAATRPRRPGCSPQAHKSHEFESPVEK